MNHLQKQDRDSTWDYHRPEPNNLVYNMEQYQAQRYKDFMKRENWERQEELRRQAREKEKVQKHSLLAQAQLRLAQQAQIQKRRAAAAARSSLQAAEGSKRAREEADDGRPKKGTVVRLKKGAKQEGCLAGGGEGVVTRDIYKERGVPEYAVKTQKGSTLYHENQLEIVGHAGGGNAVAAQHAMMAEAGVNAAHNIARGVFMSASQGMVHPDLKEDTTLGEILGAQNARRKAAKWKAADDRAAAKRAQSPDDSDLEA